MIAQSHTVIAVDIGNTQTVYACFSLYTPLWKARFPTQPGQSVEAIKATLMELFAENAIDTASIGASVIASVVPDATPAMTEALRQLTGMVPILTSPDTAGLELTVDKPCRVGTDRIASSVAAVALYPPPVIVMDLGTATTISVINKKGQFIGGTISPGLATSARALHASTAQLPLSELAAPSSVIGHNTEDSIRSGIVYGTAAMLEGLAERIEEELGQSARLVVTGGLAGLVIPCFHRGVHHEPDLLLIGLNMIARRQPTLGSTSSESLSELDLQSQSIGIIGAGRVGVSLGVYLQRSGLRIAGFSSRSRQSADLGAALTHSQSFTTAPELLSCCDGVIIATPDDQIATVWSQLRPFVRPGQWFLHCSGSLSSDVFKTDPVSGHVASCLFASLHPMYAFAHRDGKDQGMEQICFGIEGSGLLVSALKAFLLQLGHPVVLLTSQQKTCYHLANVFASNLGLGLISLSIQYLVRLGLSSSDAAMAINPLFKANLANFVRVGLPDALIGPIERNDTETIARHLSVIVPQDRACYLSLSRELLNLARQKYPDRDMREMEQLLSAEMANGRSAAATGS